MHIFDAQQQNQLYIQLITFQTMKPNLSITNTASKDLKKILNADVFNTLSKRFLQQKSRTTMSSKNEQKQTLQMRTPSTVDTTLRRRGSAISKSRRPDSKSKLKNIGTFTTNPIQNTVTKQLFQNKNKIDQQQKSVVQPQTPAHNRKVLTDRAIYYGNVQLPYLHSSDAISSLYQRPRANQNNQNPQPLINPPSNISAGLLTNVKNLFLYYTNLDTLRQLGTGWSNLKSLTVMCSYMLKDLSGLSIFPSLQYLFVPHNNICEISDVMYHTTIRCIDLQDNKLDLIDQIQYIYTINNLQWVDISQNPITQKKQKYRIISQNLGNKLQIQDHNKVSQYQLMQIDLDYQLYSYCNIQVSNNLVKQINEQILKQEIKIGEFWRIAQEKVNNPKFQEQVQTADVQIINSFNDFDQSIQQSTGDKISQLQLRVTPLTQYINQGINIQPLKKYFSNKICPQSKAEKQKQKQKDKIKSRQKLFPQQSSSNIEAQQQKIKKFSATQKLSSGATVSEQKYRLNSVSLKKRLGKLSLSKNANFVSTASSILSNNIIKPKQQIFGQVNSLTSSNGLKFITKRKLLSKQSEQIVALKF